jgi:iron(III) transport system permease protein
VALGGLVAVGMVLPVAHLVLRASEAADPLGLAASARTVHAIGRTVALAATVTAGAVALGVALAWVLERTDVPGRDVLGVVAAVPLVVPTYVLAVTFKDAFGPSPLLVELPGAVGFRGAATALVLATYPYVLLVVRATLATADPALEEAARSLGDRPARAFRRVVAPLLRPAVGAGGLLVFLYTLSDFGAVAVLRYETLTVALFGEYRTSFDRSRPAVLGVILVVTTLLALAVERRVRGRAAASRATAGVRPVPRRRLHRWRWPVAAAVAAAPVVGAGVPVGVLLYRASLGTGPSERVDILVRAALASVGLSATAALGAVALAIPVGVLVVRFRSRLAAAVEAAATAGYALPGLVVALALVFFAARYVPLVYQTPALVVAAYVIRFYPEALGAVRAALARVDPALEEVARTLGDSQARALWRVTVPLVRGGLAAGGGLVFLTAMKELPATLLLRPAGTDTLATRVWTGAAEGFYRQAAPSALLLVLVSALALGPAVRLSHRGRAE